MKKIAIYGKGGIGKSTTTSNLSVAFTKLGLSVMQIGCDPKADSTINLLGGNPATSVLSILKNNNNPTIEDVVKIGSSGVMCIETGGPTPGVGCAGRGIIATFNLLNDLNVFEKLKPDVVLYDVLGDVVCGGFAAPIREGYAEDIYIVTSGEKMALFAANNIFSAVKNFENRNYAKVKGIILNRRNIVNEYDKVSDFAKSINVGIIGDVERSDEIQVYEDKGMTIVEGDIDSKMSKNYIEIARRMYDDKN